MVRTDHYGGQVMKKYLNKLSNNKLSKNMFIRSFWVLLSLSVCLGLSACGNSVKTGDKGNEGAGNRITADTKQMTYKPEDIDNADMKGKDLNWISSGNGMIIFSQYQTIEKETGKPVSENDVDYDNFDKKYISKFTYYKYSIKDNKLTEIKDLESEDANTSVNGVSFGKSGNMLLQTSSMDDSGTMKDTVTLVDKDFKTIKTLDDVSKTITDMNNGDGSDGYMAILLAEDDKTVVVEYKSLVIFDENGKKIKETDVPTDKAGQNKEMPVEGYLMMNDGNRILINEANYGDITDDSSERNYKSIYYTYDISKDAWSDPYETEYENLTGVNGITFLDSTDKDFDYYAFYNKQLVGMKFGSDEKKGVIDFTASEINANNIMNLIDAGDGSFFINIIDDMDSGKMKFMKLTKVDPNDIKDKQEITVSVIFGSDDITNHVIDFNKKSDKYRVKLVEYGESNDPVGKFNEDIAAGHIPDLISVDNLNVSKYAEKGLFEDLTPYFDKDPDINLSDLRQNFVDACKIDGKLYFMSASFNISTLLMQRKDAEGIDKLNMDSVLKLYKSKPEGTYVFQGMPGDRLSVLDSFLSTQLNDYIDWNNGQCTFDSDGFKSLLKLCHDGAPKKVDDNAYENVPSLKDEIKEGKVLFIQNRTLFDPSTIYFYDKIFKKAGGVEYTGFPTEDGGRSYFQLGDGAFAIYSKSKVKDGAWEFIKDMFTKDYQENIIGQYNYAIPTRLDVYDDYEKLFTATEKYKAPNGQEIEPYNMQSSIDDKTTVNIKPLSKEQFDVFNDVIENTKVLQVADNDVNGIITDEAEAYFNDDKDVDQVADIIQNRVSNYVNENR
jgi:ABC-type glycerol-3-phosphate transport system substrate-binding protein